MSLPVIEQIAQAIKTRLETVTTANGYTYELSAVTRPAQVGGFQPNHLEATLNQEDPSEGESPLGYDCWICLFPVHVCVRQSATDTTPADTILNGVRSDVEKALSADRTLGGLADSMYIRAPQKWELNEGFCGITVNPEVMFHHAKGDPFTA